MIGHYLNGVLVGGVMAAAGLGAASLVSPAKPVLQAQIEDSLSDLPEADEITSAVADQAQQADAAPDGAVADTASEFPPETAPQIASEIAPDTTGEPTPAPLVQPATDAETAVGPVPTEDEVADLKTDVLAVLMPDLAPLPMDGAPPEPAPVIAGTEMPTLPALAEVDVTRDAPSVAEIVAPLVPTGPAPPALPSEDAVAVAVDLPPPPPETPDDTMIAQADPGEVQEATPDLLDPAPLLPEAEAETLPTPKAEPEAIMPLPQGDSGGLPGSRPPTLPGRATDPQTALLEPDVDGPDDGQPAATLKPTPGLGEKTEGVIIGRLPRIGDDASPTEDAEADASVSDLPPLQQFARAFENPDAKPVFAVVLIDTGETAMDRAALAALPFAVTFAIDPLAPDAANRAAIYRGAGQEVVMLATGIAEGAKASDIEVAFQSMAQGLPEAVAVMELPDLGFQDNRPLASLVVPVVAAQGRGLLTWDQGLNAADQVARREDLAAAVAFRHLDSKGEDRAAIRRLLDRAAFKAGQDGRVTVVGQTREETVAALLEWTVEGRAASVALAPLSAVLTVE